MLGGLATAVLHVPGKQTLSLSGKQEAEIILILAWPKVTLCAALELNMNLNMKAALWYALQGNSGAIACSKR